MADRTINLKLGIDIKDGIKNTEKLKDGIKGVEIQTVKAIKAEEVLQGILTSLDPLKNINKKYRLIISWAIP